MVDRTVKTRLTMDVKDYVRGAATAVAATKTLMSQVDKTNDRTAWLAQSILGLGPAAVPIAAVAVPAIAGLATQMTIASLAAGTAALAFNGVGDGLKALNAYQLEPTAENLAKMHTELYKLGPAGADFVRYLDSIGDEMKTLQTVAKEGMLPGVEEGIDAFLERLPELRNVIGEIAEGMGQLATEAGEGIAGSGFDDFFEYLDREAKPILIDMGRTMGNFIEGFANMMVDFGPLTDDFSGGLLEMSRDFAEWSDGLDQSTSFQEFMDYIRDVTPDVMDFLSSLTDALVQIVQAAAPVGDILLPALTEILDVIAKLANTPLGPAFIGLAAAMSLYGRAAALAAITTGGLFKTLTPGLAAMGANTKTASAGVRTLGSDLSVLGRNAMTAGAQTERMAAANKVAAGNIKATAAGIGAAAGAVGLFALSMSDLDDKAGLTNTTMLGLVGLMVKGGPLGFGLGAAAGLTLDLAAANNELEKSVIGANLAIKSGSLEDMKSSYAGLAEQVAGLEGINMESIGARFSSMFGDDEIGIAQSALAQLKTDIDNFGKQGDAGITTLFNTSLPGAVKTTENAFFAATASAEEFRMSLIAVNEFMNGRATFRDYQQAIDDFAESLRKAKKDNLDFLNASKSGFDVDKQIGRDLEAQFDGIAASALAYAETLKGVDRVNYLDNARKQILAAARAAGMGGKAARNLADELGLLNQTKAEPEVNLRGGKETRGEMADVKRDHNQLTKLNGGPLVKPKNVPGARRELSSVDKDFRALDRLKGGPRVDADTTGAARGFAAVRAWMRDINGDVATTYIRTERIGATTIRGSGSAAGPGLQQADGSVLDFYANGGVRENHVAQIAPAGAYRVWAEPETGGEAYIPLAQSKAGRSRMIADEVVQRLGGQAMWFANGGIAQQAPAVNVSPNVSASASFSEAQMRRFEAALERGAAKGIRDSERMAAGGRRVG